MTTGGRQRGTERGKGHHEDGEGGQPGGTPPPGGGGMGAGFPSFSAHSLLPLRPGLAEGVHKICRFCSILKERGSLSRSRFQHLQTLLAAVSPSIPWGSPVGRRTPGQACCGVCGPRAQAVTGAVGMGHIPRPHGHPGSHMRGLATRPPFTLSSSPQPKGVGN